MKLIAGLGNGDAYRRTRHNMGAEIAEILADRNDFRKEIEKIAGQKVIFLPQEGFYNNSGDYIGRAVCFYKANPTRDLLVICDDFYLDFGKLRLRLSGSSGGNNGLKSVIKTLGTENFARLRIGIDNGHKSSTDADIFVLQRLNHDEVSQIPEISLMVSLKIKEWLKNSATHAPEN